MVYLLVPSQFSAWCLYNYYSLLLALTFSFPPGADRTLVFVETKRNADFLASFLSQENFPTTSIHG